MTLSWSEGWDRRLEQIVPPEQIPTRISHIRTITEGSPMYVRNNAQIRKDRIRKKTTKQN